MTMTRRAYSLAEILFVVVTLGVVAAVVVPQFAGASDDERSTNAEIVIAGVRTSITAYRSRAVRRGADPFPSLNDLTTPGIVLMEAVPENPFTGVRGVQAVSRAQAESRAVLNAATVGWNYYFENTGDQPVVYFYANCLTPTTVPDGRGGTLSANEL
jgi:type II secretory pathway pseudopilin PulG